MRVRRTRTAIPRVARLGLAAAILLVGVAHADERQIILYPGFGTDVIIVEGRVIEARGGNPETPTDSWLTNVFRTLRRLISDEEDDVAVRIRLDGREWRTVTDDEGYFRVPAESAANAPVGWREVEAVTEAGDARATGSVLRVPPANSFGVISDVDDTILISHVTDKSRLLRNVFLLNYAQREPVAGTAALYARIAQRNPIPDAAPIFYLSASPRQLQAGIQTFLDRNGFPRGVLITKKITNDATGDSLFDSMTYKRERIEQLLAAVPRARFVLVGDDGERDPEVYDDIRRRYPKRIEAVWIRKAADIAPRTRYPDQRDLADVLANSKTGPAVR